MEEDEYKSTYGELTQIPCAYEKALTNRKAACVQALHFCLADREGYACRDSVLSDNCRHFLETLREKSRFSLKLQNTKDPLAHNMELKIQVGGLQGLMCQVTPSSLTNEVVEPGFIENIQAVLDAAQQQYKAIALFPYSEIVQSVTRYKGRQRRKR